MRWRVGLWLLAIVAVVVPRTGPFVESRYANGLFPWLQRVLTTASNVVPFALFDLLLVAVIAGVMIATLADLTRRPRDFRRAAGCFASRLATAVAAAYLAFLVTWGFNYRRTPLTERVRFDPSRITVSRAQHLASESARQVNALYETAHRERWSPSGRVDGLLASAFGQAHRLLGSQASFVAGRPKRTLLDLYFRRTGVAGMTDPYFLETLVASDLLVVEQPMVIAHEWSHLAGIADEGEANFAGWLTCLRGSPLHQYSGWLFLYGEVMAGLPAADAQRVAATLDDGPRADVQAIRDRLLQQLSPSLAAMGWSLYDGYLRANHVDEGTASYATVVRMILGTGDTGIW